MNAATADDSITLLSDVNDTDGADLTFGRVMRRIREASDSIEIHMFVWRSDDIGNRIGREILEAANRGVKIHIKKDTGAFMYERIEMNRKSFFNKPIAAPTRLMYKIRALTFPDTYVEDDRGCELGDQIMAHDKITIDWVDHTHTKYYIFDERVMITGSINIEDRHRGYRDYMVEICGGEYISRFRSRNTNAVPYDPNRPLDFVPNSVIDGKRAFEIKQTMLDLLSQANHTVYIEMAYIGDPDVSRKIIEIANRGVRVTMLFSKEANIGNDVNYRSLFCICKQADIAVYLSHKMIHSKLMLIDDEIVILGSANISIFSMQKAVELDVTVKDNPAFVEAVKKTIDQRVSEGTKVESTAELANYSRVLAAFQQLHQKLH
ncbi:MAG: phosphatidylserine/phosphatidylglycerophosphate/cardiolipin synthase family protein [Planctomycetes bacterium]|nr:phosphatidylserine/phosphatidylglycerophosphate/cardiolipin synthase family protein [Planctomycetota bacterium]MBL7043479.1 phosphatidylserine/phosphatidylglycerophosphate/cardiolipin synthase family protein [Pirellulaceae bacterium]